MRPEAYATAAAVVGEPEAQELTARRARRYAHDCERTLEIIALPPAWHAAGSEVRAWLARAERREADARAAFVRPPRASRPGAGRWTPSGASAWAARA